MINTRASAQSMDVSASRTGNTGTCHAACTVDVPLIAGCDRVVVMNVRPTHGNGRTGYSAHPVNMAVGAGSAGSIRMNMIVRGFQEITSPSQLLWLLSIGKAPRGFQPVLFIAYAWPWTSVKLVTFGKEGAEAGYAELSIHDIK